MCILASHFIIIPEALEIAFLRFKKRREALYSVTTASFLPFAFFVLGKGGWLDGVFFFFFTWIKSAPFSHSLPHLLICGVLMPFVKPSCSLSGAKEVLSIQGYRSKGHRGPEQKRAVAKLEGGGISELCASVVWCTFLSKGVHRPKEWTENIKKKPLSPGRSVCFNNTCAQVQHLQGKFSDSCHRVCR